MIYLLITLDILLFLWCIHVAKKIRLIQYELTRIHGDIGDVNQTVTMVVNATVGRQNVIRLPAPKKKS